MTNWEWLEALANNSPDELQAWFDSEHGDTAALEAKIAELTVERDKLKELNGYHAAQYELASEDCDRLQVQVDELQAIADERWNKYIAEHLRADTLADDLLTANRQREQYRELMRPHMAYCPNCGAKVVEE